MGQQGMSNLFFLSHTTTTLLALLISIRDHAVAIIQMTVWQSMTIAIIAWSCTLAFAACLGEGSDMRAS